MLAHMYLPMVLPKEIYKVSKAHEQSIITFPQLLLLLLAGQYF